MKKDFRIFGWICIIGSSFALTANLFGFYGMIGNVLVAGVLLLIAGRE